MATPSYPLYEMFIDGERRLMPLGEAGVMYDNGYCKVDIGSVVMVNDHELRDLTDSDRRQIRDGADAYSNSR